MCVWDDLVDIPVATPLRVPSAEMRRKRVARSKDTDQEEMDISVANASAPAPQHDLLGLGLTPVERPSPNRFNVSRSASHTDVRPSDEGHASQDPSAPSMLRAGPDLGQQEQVQSKRRAEPTSADPRQVGVGRLARSHARSSLEDDVAPRQAHASGRRRGNSLSTRSHTISYEGDDLEGDLGYAAAQGMEKNQRKVIVERLETVKSKSPFFTWC